MDNMQYGERFIYLAGALCELDALPDVLEEKFIDYLAVEDIVEVFSGMPGYVLEALEQGNRGCAEVFAEWLVDSRKFGFLVHMETPVMQPHPGGSCSYTWGRFTSRWFYADTLDQAFEKGFAWVESVRSRERQKAGLE